MKRMHLCMDVRGALNMTKPEMHRMAKNITYNGKQLKTADEVKSFLLDALSEGYEFLPMTECDNFDKKRGCMGHEIQSVTTA